MLACSRPDLPRPSRFGAGEVSLGTTGWGPSSREGESRRCRWSRRSGCAGGGLTPSGKTWGRGTRCRQTRSASHGVLDMALARDVYMRDAAYMAAIDRVVRAMDLRGWI